MTSPRQAEPTDAELSAYLTAHPDAFRVAAAVHVQPGLSQSRHGTASTWRATPRRCSRSCSRPAARPTSRTLGDPFLLEHALRGAAGQRGREAVRREVRGEAGRASARPMAGAVESGYGVHLVFVSERTEGRVPALAEVRDAVRREWANARRLEANEKFYAGAAQALRGDHRDARSGEADKRSRRRREMKRGAPRSSSCSPLLAPGASRARGASRLSGAAPDRRRKPTTCSGRCRGRAKTCASDSTWSFRRAARTSPRRGRRWSTTPSPSAGPSNAPAD